MSLPGYEDILGSGQKNEVILFTEIYVCLFFCFVQQHYFEIDRDSEALMYVTLEKGVCKM